MRPLLFAVTFSLSRVHSCDNIGRRLEHVPPVTDWTRHTGATALRACLGYLTYCAHIAYRCAWGVPRQLYVGQLLPFDRFVSQPPIKGAPLECQGGDDGKYFAVVKTTCAVSVGRCVFPNEAMLRTAAT